MTALSKLIHTGFGQLGIREEAEQRAILLRATGKPSLREMVPAEEEAVVAELERLGFKRSSKRLQGQPDMSGKYGPPIRALWIALYNLGKVRDRRDSAITAFVRGQTEIDAVRFVHHHDDAEKIIEALKGIAKRAGVNWHHAPQTWLENDRAKIAWAQWKMLRPGATLPCRYEFDLQVGDIIGDRKLPLSRLSNKQWQDVMNAFGQRIRAAKKGGA